MAVSPEYAEAVRRERHRRLPSVEEATDESSRAAGDWRNGTVVLHASKIRSYEENLHSIVELAATFSAALHLKAERPEVGDRPTLFHALGGILAALASQKPFRPAQGSVAVAA